MKCKEKNGLNLELGYCGKTKVFPTQHLRYFFFESLGKYKCVIFFKLTKSAIFYKKKRRKSRILFNNIALSPEPRIFNAKNLSLQILGTVPQFILNTSFYCICNTTR